LFENLLDFTTTFSICNLQGRNAVVWRSRVLNLKKRVFFRILAFHLQPLQLWGICVKKNTAGFALSRERDLDLRDFPKWGKRQHDTAPALLKLPEEAALREKRHGK